jgi:hypothetical protein
MNESIQFNFDSETATQAALRTLARHNLYVIRSFDLRSALQVHGGCECPHHGTTQCNCQFVVLLVYGEAAEPVVVTIHSRDNQAEAVIVHDATTLPDPRLAEEVIGALVEAAITLQVIPTFKTVVTAHAG